MNTKRRTFSWIRAAVVVWASVWMLAVPLFHVHPEADHRHGEIGHVHGGTVHTVWSPDLDCEFDGHQQGDRTKASAQDGIGDIALFSHAGDTHSEVSLSLLSDSTDRKLLKPFVAQAFGVSSVPTSDVKRSVRIVWSAVSVPLPVPYSPTPSPRAPPSLLI